MLPSQNLPVFESGADIVRDPGSHGKIMWKFCQIWNDGC
jgi:hypothetical protein